MNKDKNPRVSVVIPTYHRDYSLKRAIISLYKQTYDNIEIIVVDDNADEEWNRKVKKILEEISEFRNCDTISLKYIVNNENLGSARTRNRGIENATGKYTTFLDDDDIYLPDKVLEQLKDIIKNEADYSITNLKLYNENGCLIETRNRGYVKKNDVKSLMTYHLKYHMTGTDTLMFKTDYLKKIGGFPLFDMGDEFFLMEKAIKSAGKISYLNRCDVHAVVHSSETGISSGITKIEGEKRLFNYKKRYFKGLSIGDKQYIRMRHCAVIAFAELRRKYYGHFIIWSFKAFLCSPISAIELIFNMKKGEEK